MINPVSVDSDCATSNSDPLACRIATTADCDSLATLINSSYRGELAHQSWTNENDIVSVQAVTHKEPN
jgi:hypothetical protein